MSDPQPVYSTEDAKPIDLDLLAQRVAEGLVSEVRHKTLPLTLYNYTQRCQFERLWDEVTKQCRGLIIDKCGKVRARPFAKFFNDGEHDPSELPWHLGCEVTEKLDGSLGILFNFGGEWHWATRGSFASVQAIEAAAIWGRSPRENKLDPSCTYLFEIIFPENRIVVNYGDRRELVLLAIIDTATGREFSLDEAPEGLSVVRRFPPTASIADIRTIIRDDEEGYVVRFANGFRVKVKGDRYIQLHKIMSGVSSRSIWETLSEGRSFDEMLEVVPDEFADWVRKERASLLAQYCAAQGRITECAKIARGLPSRKDQAALILSHYKDVSSACFAQLDGKPVPPFIWRQLYPEYRRPELAGRMDS